MPLDSTNNLDHWTVGGGGLNLSQISNWRLECRSYGAETNVKVWYDDIVGESVFVGNDYTFDSYDNWGSANSGVWSILTHEGDVSFNGSVTVNTQEISSNHAYSGKSLRINYTLPDQYDRVTLRNSNPTNVQGAENFRFKIRVYKSGEQNYEWLQIKLKDVDGDEWLHRELVLTQIGKQLQFHYSSRNGNFMIMMVMVVIIYLI